MPKADWPESPRAFSRLDVMYALTRCSLISNYLGIAAMLKTLIRCLAMTFATFIVTIVSTTSASAQTVTSQAKWPVKPIHIVVAFPPGGLTDAYARMYAEQITTQLGVPAVVENKPGAGAIIGIDYVARSAPDGYTLLMTTSGTV